MKKIDQAVCNSQNGDCFRACVASIFEFDGIPNFQQDGPDGWAKHLTKFSDRTGILFLDFNFENLPDCRASFLHELKDTYIIASGPSPRDNTKQHAVIWRNGEIVHDPHPDKTGIEGEPNIFTLMIIKDPQKLGKFFTEHETTHEPE